MTIMINKNIEEDMKESYLDYAMSVIVGRALPDIRDGLKPVHRRILYAMYELKNFHDKPYKKSARIVGEVLGKYHPHGDTAIYDSLVRMAQPFNMRYVLIDGQGNFGSIDGDSAAAMRYTEVRMKKIAEEMLLDITKETVPFIPNFDNSLKEPIVLPSKIPNLLINGSSGIAVGMSTNIPPHNLNEICDAIIAFIDGAEEDEVLEIVKGPDFPTGGIILGKGGIKKAYKTGKGIIKVRAKAEITEKGIKITQIPYQITKTKIIEEIADAVKKKKIEGISGIQDRSDKRGLEIFIDLKRDAIPEVVLNQLFAHTDLEKSFGIINLALVNGTPKLLSLYDMISLFVDFRKEIIYKRTEYELKQAKARAHILEGLKIALDNIDSVIKLIKSSSTPQVAKEGLISKFHLSEKQAEGILNMKLQRLTNLEKEKIENELKELLKLIDELNSILNDEKKIYEIIKKETNEIKNKYGDERRTEILNYYEEVEEEDLIPNEEVVLFITKRGYVKRIPIDEYKTQNRGGKGIIGIKTKEEDMIEDIIITKSHNYILFFTNKGRVYWLKAYKIPEMSRYSSGKPIVNLLNIKDEKISAWISLENFEDYLVMATKNGVVKRIKLEHFSRPRRGGIIAITLKKNDELIDVKRTKGNNNIVLATKKGKAIQFNENEIREIGRTGQGVRGIRLDNDEVVSIALNNKKYLLTISENGYGKKTSFDQYRLQGRGGKGIINMNVTEKTGFVVGSKAVNDEDEVLIISSGGNVIRVKAEQIRTISRNTQGVKLITLEQGDKVTDFSVI